MAAFYCVAIFGHGEMSFCRRLMQTVLVGMVVSFAGVPAAMAHAFLTHADPPAGSALRKPPARIALTFSEEIEPAFSTIEVIDAAGQRVDKGKASVDPNSPTVLRIALKPLPPGVYKVIWRAVSVDTHTTQGHFSFRVSPD